MQMLGVGARFLLLGDRAAAGDFPPDLPAHADASVRRLLGIDPPFATLDEATAALKDLGMRPASVSRGRRVAQILLTGVWLTTVVLVTYSAVELETPGGAIEPVARNMVQALAFVTIYALPSVLLAIALRGGLTYALLGLRLRNRRGHRASRLRCGLRAAVVCLPAFPAIASSWIPVPAEWRDAMAVGSTILIYGALAAWSIVNPLEGPADRLARTRIVRR
jgi:hypothetical protein